VCAGQRASGSHDGVAHEAQARLFGAITSKPNKAAQAELKPELQGKGYVYYSPIVTCDRIQSRYLMRPCVGFAGNPLNYVRKRAAGGYDEPLIDTTVFRQGTEGLYAGVEWTNPPDNVRAALNSHPRFQSICQCTRSGAGGKLPNHHAECGDAHCHSCLRVCEETRLQGRDHLREAQRGARDVGHDEEVAKEVAKNYPGIALWSTNIDAQLMWLNKNPEEYNVIVASNLFGDILSDAFAGLVGGLGFAASGNIGDDVAVFEPTHGSAPKYAELNPPIVNPIAMILSAAMMLDHVHEDQKAKSYP